jgi:hypothetical protein
VHNNYCHPRVGEAALEAEKMLTYYELDLGLNHVIRKWSEPVNRTANCLLSVPGGNDGPGGVLICSEGWVSYKNQVYRLSRIARTHLADLLCSCSLNFPSIGMARMHRVMMKFAHRFRAVRT